MALNDLFSVSNPSGMMMLGLANALGRAAMPSRMPISLGAALGAGAGGMMQGYQQGLKDKAQLMKNQMAEQQLDYLSRLRRAMSPQPGTTSAPAVGSTPGGLLAPTVNTGGLLNYNQAADAAQTNPAAFTPASAPTSAPVSPTSYFNPTRLFLRGLYAEGLGLPGGAQLVQTALQYDPTMVRRNTLLKEGYVPDGNGGYVIDPNYVKGQGTLAGAKAAASAPYDVAKSLASRAGQAVALSPGQSRTTGFEALPQPVQRALTNIINGATAPAPTTAPQVGGAVTTPATLPAAPAGTSIAPGTTGTNATGFPVQSIHGQEGTLQSPLTLEGAKLQGNVLPKQYEDAQKNYQAAQQVLGSLNMVDHAINTLNQTGWTATGTGANARLGAMKALNTFATNLGLQAPFDPGKVATWEDFNKETTRMGMQLVHSMFGGSREASMIVQGAISAVPSAENSYLGGKLVSSSLREAAQRQMDYYEYLTDYAQSHAGNTLGADVAFNKTHPVKSYINQALVNAVPPEARAYLVQHPDTAKQFDQTFGANVSKLILGE
jgi:hypothetical protein